MYRLLKSVIILLSISFVFGQNWNTKGTVPMTFRVTVEPYMPPGEIMSIEFWKNGAVEDPPSNPHFKPTANRRFHVPMKKIGKNQWEAIVELDTSAYEGAWADSRFIYHYNRNHFMPAMQNREPLKTPQLPDGQYMPLPSDNPTDPNRNGFGWHRRANMVQNDTIKQWWWPFPDPKPTLNTTGHLSSPPNNIKSSDFNVGITFPDWHRYYWSGIIPNWMDNVVRTNSTWMQIIPVTHYKQHNPPLLDHENEFPNALPDSNMVKLIKEAHKRGLKVYLNNLEVSGGGMELEAAWDESVINREWYIKFLAERRKLMLHQATIAQEHGVEMLKFNLWHVPRIIDEYESLVDSISLVVLNEVKAIYKGKIIMDWRDKDTTLKIYEHADMLRATLVINNMTGHGYKDSDEPSVENILAAARKKMINDVLPFYEKYKKPILVEMLFASSYENSPGSAGQHWDNIPGYSHFYEDDPSIAINEQVQANMYEAAMVLMHEYDWIIGTYSFNYTIASIYDKEVGIRGKLAEQVVRKWYRWINPNKTHLTTTINENTSIAPYTQGGTVSHLGSYLLSKDTTVTVTASADDGYGFVKWTGDASGTSPTVTVSMDTDKTISAIFEVVNQSPVVAALSDTTMKEDESITVTLSASDEEGDAITFSATSDTTLTVSVSSDTLTITPKLNWHGVASVIVYASDGYSKGQALFDITVTPVNDLPTSFEWVSSALDTVNISKNNTNDDYTLEWAASTDEADGDTIDYLVYAQIGVYPSEEIYDTTVTKVNISNKEFLNNVFELTPGAAATVRFTVYAHDGTDSIRVTGDDRVVYVNRYEFLSTEGEGIPTEFALHENYPNPFNPSTTLRFDLPELSDVNMIIYNMLGQKVKTFNMQSTPAGYHSLTWNATNDYGDPLSAGVYLYQLKAKDFVKTRKMVLLK